MSPNSEEQRGLKALYDAVQDARPEPDSGRADLQPGSTFGDYEIVRLVGRGGMGAVYEAVQGSLDRRVALKILHPALTSSARSMARFRLEAEAVARVPHAAIVPLFEVGMLEGLPFFSMRFLDGPDLGELISRLRDARDHGDSVVRLRPDPGSHEGTNTNAARLFDRQNHVFLGVELFADLADGLQAAHRAGIVHRDVKPGNLVFDRTGKLVLTDFGIAKSEDRSTLTRTGEFVGSPGYISPEQAMAGRISVDHRTDIYSLGVTLYELLTLQQPFLGDTFESTLRAILTRDPTPPRKLNPRMPKDVETVILKAMEKDPGLRYQSAGEMASDLRRILNFEAVHAVSAGLMTRLSRKMQRRRGLSVAMALAVIVGVTGGLVWDDQRKKDEARGLRASAAEGVAMSLRQPAAADALIRFVQGEVASDDALSRLQEVHTLLEKGQLEEALDVLHAGDIRLEIAASLGDPLIWRYRPSLAEAKVRLAGALGQRLAAAQGPLASAGPRRLLGELLEDADPLVVKNAAVGLGRHGGVFAIPLLLHALDSWGDLAQSSATHDVRPDLVEALATLDVPEVFEVLQSLAQSEDFVVTRWASKYLADWEEPQ